MSHYKRFLLALLILAAVGPAWSVHIHPQLQTTITVSGTVTGPGSVPVVDAHVEAWLPTDEGASAITNAAGFYELTIPPGDIAMSVQPPLASRLAQRNIHIGYRDASFTQDFEVVAGYLLAGTVLLPNGDPPDTELWVGFDPVSFSLPKGEWLGAAAVPGSGEFQAVAPVGVYWVGVTPPAPYYPTYQPIDLTSGDVTGVVLTLGDEPTNPIPYDPPDASRITIGPPDDLGEATVTGAPGAALPLAHVLLVNLNSTHQAHAISEADGSFTARIFAPPGSAVMVKHGPVSGSASWRWSTLDVGIGDDDGLNPFPGTIINLPHTHAGNRYELPFAAAGAIDYYTDDKRTTRNYVGSAWAMTGTIGPVVVEGQWTRVLTGTYDGQVEPGLYLGGLNWTHPALDDLDGDGDLDLLVGERFGHLVLYRNLGSATSPDWQFETADYAGVATGWWAYPALADVTGDGAPDLFVGTNDGQVHIYYNDGTSAAPIWPDSPDVSLSAGNNAAPALDDLDGDGDLDLLVGHEGGTLYYFKNTGTLANPVWTRRTSSYGGISEEGEEIQPAFVDLDGDGDQDLLIGRCGDLVWYRNNGPPSNPTWDRVTDGYAGISGSCGISPGVGDWDGDGDVDMVIGHHLGRLGFYRNDGPPAAPSWKSLGDHFFPFDFHAESAPAAADLDADGDLDLLVGQLWGELHYVRNDGTSTVPDWSEQGVVLTLPWTNHPHPFPAFADIDGDDDYDLFIGEGSWEGPEAGGNIRYYRNDGTPASPDWTLVTANFLGLDVGGWSMPVFVDIDNDNDLDLFIGDAAGTLTFVENIGSATSPSWAAPVRPYAGLDLGSYSAPTFFDVDEDGDLDMLVGLEGGSLAYVRNTGTVNSPAWELVSTQYLDIDIGDHSTPTAADMNGDGKPDLLIGDGDGGLNLYLYEGPGTPPMTGDTYAPGDLFQVEGTIRLYSPAITATTDVEAISVDGWLSLMMLFNQDGQPMATANYFMSTMLTPSGFPIQLTEWSVEWLDIHFNVGDLHYLGGHAIEGSFVISGQIPDDLPPGIYRPLISLGFTGVPTSTQWLAASVVHYTYNANEAVLPPIRVGTVAPPRLIWRLLMDDFVQGTRGTGAREDRGTFELASQIVSQGAPYYTPPVDVRTGQPITYRLAPFLPMISFTDRRMPTPPLIPFDLPGGQLCVEVQKPDGTVRDLGCEAFAQSFNRAKTTRVGNDLNPGTVQLEDVYSLTTADERFRATFDQYGHHVITTTGVISDLWGNSYTGGGTYDVWIAHPLDIDPGVLPGTPLAVGDAFNPAMQFYPRVPADVYLTLTLYPDSDPAQVITHTISGQANRFGYFSSSDHALRNTQHSISNTQYPMSLTHPGEYRVDVTAIYTDTSGEMYMGAMTWGGVVMTPENEAHLIAHGRRGLDSLNYIPNHWFVACRDLNIPPGAISHTFNPYFNGDILWSRMSDNPCGGDSLLLGASVQDTVGVIEAAVRARAERQGVPLSSPGSLSERFSKGEIPLFISTRSGNPAQFVLGQIGATIPDDVDQIAYSYRSSQRPGVRVREVVAEDGQTGGYWRLDTLYDDQLSVGVQGDQPNDFKFQYVGTVYRDLETDVSQYGGHGSLWIFIPDDDATGSRVMPPFAGPGNGGWTTEGGPILTLKGKDVHIFILPTGVRPGAVLEVGDTFRFAGHIAPTLNSKVAFTVTSPSGVQHLGGGQANRIGYFYDPADDFTVDEPGLWSVDVRVWHDGTCSGGQTVPPYPSGDVLGSEDGRYWFYVVARGASRLPIYAPSPGFLSFDDEVTPITIAGPVPAGLSDVTVDYTISMPGYILEHGQVTPSDGEYRITFDPAALHEEFPNLDLTGRDDWRAGLADTFAIGLLLRGRDAGGNLIYRANTITIQGEEVFVGADISAECYDFVAPPGINAADIMIVASRWRDSTRYSRFYDVMPDGIINIVDIMLVAARWGESCP